MVNHNVIYKSGLPNRAIAVYIYLCDRANKEGQSWPSMRRMAEDLNVSRRTIMRAVDDLRAAGYVKTEHRIKSDGGWGSLVFFMCK